MNNENDDHKQGFSQVSLAKTSFFRLAEGLGVEEVLSPAFVFSVLMIQMHSNFRHPLYRTMGEAWALL